MADIPPCVFDLYVAPNLDAPSLAEFSLVSRNSATCVHGSSNYESTQLFLTYCHPTNVLVRADTTGCILGSTAYTVSYDKTELIRRTSECAKVTEFNLAYSPVNSAMLGPIVRCMPALRRLNLSGTYVSTIDEIAPCIHLTDLYLANTQVRDISVLAACTTIRELDIGSTNVESIGVVTMLPTLVRLSFYDTPVTVLPALPLSLARIDMGQTRVVDISAIGYCTRLTHLNISCTSVQSIDPLATCTLLQELDMRRTLVSSLHALRRSFWLHTLNADRTLIRSVKPLVSCWSLRKLFIPSTHIRARDVLSRLIARGLQIVRNPV